MDRQWRHWRQWIILQSSLPRARFLGERKKPHTRGSAQEGGHHLSLEMDDSSIGRKSISKLLNNVKETSLVVSSNVNRKRAFLLKTQIVLIIEMPREDNFSLQKPRI